MKTPRRLSSIERTHLNSISRFARELNSIAGVTQSHDLEQKVSYLAINILNCWSNFNRTYFLSCASGALSPSGRLITSDLAGLNYNDLIGNAIRQYKNYATPKSNGTWDSRFEPTWHDSATLLKLAKVFNFSNLSDIDSAFSMGFTAHKNLVVFRNYFGHKNMDTMQKAKNIASTYSIQSNQKPTQILLSSPHLSASSLLEVWKTEISDTISYLCS